MACGRLRVLPGLDLSKVSVHFLVSDVQTGRLIGLPCVHRLLLERLAVFLPLDTLCDGFAHDPMRRAAAEPGQIPYSLLQEPIELD